MFSYLGRTNAYQDSTYKVIAKLVELHNDIN